MMSLGVCHVYFCTAHIHLVGWSMVSSQRGVCLLNDVCWGRYISLAMFVVIVRILPCGYVGS